MPAAQIRVRVSLYLVLQEVKVQILLPNTHCPASPPLASRSISPAARGLLALPSLLPQPQPLPLLEGSQGRRHTTTIVRAGRTSG